MIDQLDILLINIGAKKKVYQGLSKDYSACEPPFWAALTAGYIRSNKFSVEILDANGLNLDQRETAERVKQLNPQITAIVVYGQQANTCTPLMVAVEQQCREIKRLIPNGQLVLTGWHPSALPERTLRETAADMLAQGEGFYTLVGLLQGKPHADIPGLWLKQDGHIVPPGTPQKNVPELTAELNTVAWDLIPWEQVEYRAFNWMCLEDLESRGHYASLYTSLGCPYNCTYCGIQATYGDRQIRYWSLEWVMRQIDTLARDFGVRNINLIDELFVFNPDHYLPIAKELIAREYQVNICAFARVDAVDRIAAEDLALLKAAGFNWFKLGIETSNVEILGAIDKGTYTKSDIRRVVSKTHQAGIDICANFMFGLPGDDYETMQDTLSFAHELNCTFPSFFCTMATPGSELYRQALEENIALPETWLGYAQQGYDFLPLPTEKLTAAQVLAFRDYAFDSYFTNPRYLDMIRQRFTPEALEHIQGMTNLKLKRKILGD